MKICGLFFSGVRSGLAYFSGDSWCNLAVSLLKIKKIFSEFMSVDVQMMKCCDFVHIDMYPNYILPSFSR